MSGDERIIDITMQFTDISLEERIKNGTNLRDVLKDRAQVYFDITKGNLPVEGKNGTIGCPVCFSKLSHGNLLVREDGYIVCDYCVNYVEGYT